jgi:LPS export ABC transporter protein LptC
MNSSLLAVSVGCFTTIILGLILTSGPLWSAGLTSPQGDLIMNDFGYTEYRSGVKRWTVRAQNAKHDFAGGSARVEVLHLQLFSTEGAPDLSLKADSGVLKIAERTVELQGEVEAEDLRGYQFSTDQLLYDDHARIAHGTGPILVESEGLKITGHGFDYAAATGIFRIHQGVEALITAPLK